jgi:hypothetical protein
MRTGTIKDFRGSWGSGIATLVLEVDGHVKHIHCENAPTVRALQAMFPDVIVAGQTIDVPSLVDREVEFEIDGNSGILLGLGPVEK